MTQQVDPVVSKSKFEKELNAFKEIEVFYRERGILLLRAEFPNIVLGFMAYKVRPLVMAFAVKLDFTNYDLMPPSLSFVDSLTEANLNRVELGVHLYRQLPSPNQLPDIPGKPMAEPQLQDLIQSHAPHHMPFVCIPGIREYHEHPFHTNDTWLSRRGKGEGTLGFIIDQLHKYGTEQIYGLLPNAVNMNPVNPVTMIVQFQGITFAYQNISA